MKTNTLFNLTLALLVASSMAFAQDVTEHGPNFIDEDGDGYHDLAPDVDGDGIPNGLDEDYTGARAGNGAAGFIDENGDGFNDNAPDDDGDGIPNFYDDDYEGSMRQGQGGKRGFVDEDGDGINDRAGQGRNTGSRGFIDANGDGINDRFDHDGDGVPNFEDTDFDPTTAGTVGGGLPRGRGERGPR